MDFLRLGQMWRLPLAALSSERLSTRRSYVCHWHIGYSKQPFVSAVPSQAQEAFLEGHVRAFGFLDGVPWVLVYDNLKAAVKRVL